MTDEISSCHMCGRSAVCVAHPPTASGTLVAISDITKRWVGGIPSILSRHVVGGFTVSASSFNRRGSPATLAGCHWAPDAINV
jgi:hypothetical protein